VTRLSDDRGFTLIEVLVAMVIAGICFGGILAVLGTMMTSSAANRRQAESQATARTVQDRLSVSLRNGIAAPPTGATVIERGTPYDLIFQTVDAGSAPTVGNPLSAMRVRYCMAPSSPDLRMQTQRWTTTVPPAAPAATACDTGLNGWGDSRVVATDLVNRTRVPNRPLLVYGPAAPPTLAQIRTIQTTLVVDADPANLTGERTLTGGVLMRNANQPPTPVLSYTQAGGSYLFNASASTDPDGDAVTYAWKRDGATIVGETGVRLRAAVPTPGPAVTFTLIVTDAGGLTAQANRTVP
jgi:prepilin-type N-terminal cleavage/methylation domain-containing protein